MKRFLRLFLGILLMVMLTSCINSDTKVVEFLNGKSMEPTISLGDVVVVRECNIYDVKIGDIILYYPDPKISVSGASIISRVIEIKETENGIELITKGDNNALPNLPVTENQLYGVVIEVKNKSILEKDTENYTYQQI